MCQVSLEKQASFISISADALPSSILIFFPPDPFQVWTIIEKSCWISLSENNEFVYCEEEFFLLRLTSQHRPNQADHASESEIISSLQLNQANSPTCMVYLPVDFKTMFACSVPDECPQDVADLIEACMEEDSAKRPSAKDIINRIESIPITARPVPQPPWYARWCIHIFLSGRKVWDSSIC